MNKLTVAVIGCGGMGYTHLQSLLKTPLCNQETLIACESQPERRAKIAEELSVQVATDWQEVLRNPEVDAVVIACPNRLHAEVALNALNQGKHVLLEKPMALNEPEARALVEASRKHNRVLHIGFELRNSLFPRLVKEMITDGRLGPLVSGQVVEFRGHFWPDWKGRRADGGSMFLMETCHILDLFRWWNHSEVSEIHAVGARRNLVPHYEYPESQTVSFILENGFMGSVMTCHTRSAMVDEHVKRFDDIVIQDPQWGHQYEYSLTGEKGSLYFIPLQRKVFLYRHELQKDGSLRQRLVETMDFSNHPDHRELIHDTSTGISDFLSAASENRDTNIAPEDALQTHLACYAAQEALDSKRPWFRGG